MKKSILKRFKITKSGKTLRSATGINHFQAKKARSKQTQKKRGASIDKIRSRMIKSYLYR